MDGHVEDLIEVRNTLQNPSLADVVHHSILQAHGECITLGLILASTLLSFLELRDVTGDDVVEGDWVLLVDELEFDLFD